VSSISPSPPLRVTFRFGGEEVDVSPGGEIDIATAPDLAALVDAAAGRHRNRLVLDLADVAFMDVTGLNLVIRLASRLKESGGELIVRSASCLTRRLFDLVGLSDLVETDRTALDAGRGEPSASGAVVRSLDEMRTASTGSRERIVDAALGLVVAWAAATITSADNVSVTLRRRGRLTTVASSDDLCARLDGDQYATGQGPCVHAATTGEQTLIASTADETRWPDFLPHALDAGISTILSTPLTVASGPVGALNMYSRGIEGFGPDHHEIAELITGQAAAVLAGAGDDLTAAEHIERLQDALAAREVIAQAQGVLMQRYGMTATTAAAHLRGASRSADIPLQQLAAALVGQAAAANDPSPDE
jgi:anti-anti-sigma factor